MPDTLLPDELAEGLRLLEGRASLLCVPTRRVAPSEWAALEPEVGALIPAWIRELLASHAVAGCVLAFEDDDPHHTWMRCFRFYEPADYAVVLEEGSLFRHLATRFGYFPFANEADGSAWVFRLDLGPQSEIFLLEHSDWNGDVPDKRNGLRFACSRLELLLCHMAISPQTYPEGSGVPRCLKWFPARPAGPSDRERAVQQRVGADERRRG